MSWEWSVGLLHPGFDSLKKLTGQPKTLSFGYISDDTKEFFFIALVR